MMSVTGANQLNNVGVAGSRVSPVILSPSLCDINAAAAPAVDNTTQWEQNFEAKIKDLSPGEQEAVRRFWRYENQKFELRFLESEAYCVGEQKVSARNISEGSVCNLIQKNWNFIKNFI